MHSLGTQGVHGSGQLLAHSRGCFLGRTEAFLGKEALRGNPRSAVLLGGLECGDGCLLPALREAYGLAAEGEGFGLPKI